MQDNPETDNPETDNPESDNPETHLADTQTGAPRDDAAPAYPQANDTRLLTPLLLMGLIIATGILLFSITGQTPAAHG